MTTTRDRVVLMIVGVIGVIWMLIEKNAERAALVFLGGLWVESGVFWTLYATRSNWRATPAGRSVLSLVFTLWALVTWLFAQWIFKDAIPYRDVLRKFFYFCLMLALLRLNIVLWRMQRASR